MLTFDALGVGAIGSHGRPSPLVQVRVVDPDDDEVPAGEIGEIVARGPTVMNGYWNRPERDRASASAAAGTTPTTSAGARPTVRSRSSGPRRGMIKSAAENIYPAEVEGCLKQHPAVADVRGDRRARPDVDAGGEGGRRAARRRDRDRRRAHRALPRRTSRRTRSRGRSSSSTQLPRDGFAVDYDALDAQFGGGGYPGATMGRDDRAPSPRRWSRTSDLEPTYRRRIRVVTLRPASVWRARGRLPSLRRDPHHDGEHVIGLHDGRSPLAVVDMPGCGRAAAGAGRHGPLGPFHRGRSRDGPEA